MLMSVCLQSIVDELLNQKEGTEFNNVQVNTTINCAEVQYLIKSFVSPTGAAVA